MMRHPGRRRRPEEDAPGPGIVPALEPPCRSAHEVDHPTWDVHPVRSHRIDLDWSAVYGAEWSFLGDARPCSTILAAGSPVRVSGKRL